MGYSISCTALYEVRFDASGCPRGTTSIAHSVYYDGIGCGMHEWLQWLQAIFSTGHLQLLPVLIHSNGIVRLAPYNRWTLPELSRRYIIGYW
jgi:hypothetical protein